MSESKSIPRLLQRPAPDRDSDPSATPAGTPSADGGEMDKGDRKPLTDTPKPNRHRETGDLERSERDDHGRAAQD